MIRRNVLLLTVAILTAGLIGCDEKRHLAKVEGNDPTSRQISKLMVDLLANDPQVRIQAAQRLGEMKDGREAVTDALADRLKDNDPRVRQAAANALQQIGTLNAFSELKEGATGGIIEARTVYADVTQRLRRQADKGDREALQNLRALGERFID